MKRLRWVLIVCFMTLPQMSWANLTNTELLQQAAKAAAEKVVGQLPTSERFLTLHLDSPRTLDWAVEEAMTSSLTHAGFLVYKLSPATDTAGPTLTYRIVELGITYQDKSQSVERVATVRIAYSLTQGGAGRILAAGDGQGTAGDQVPASLLVGLETSEIVPVKLPPKESLGSRLLEPALLSAVVAGLIYLFYASKAAK